MAKKKYTFIDFLRISKRLMHDYYDFAKTTAGIHKRPPMWNHKQHRQQIAAMGIGLPLDAA